MRGFYVDERDSTWERDDARYRVYVFKGPSNAVTTLDILEASVEEALESAVALSNADEHLWSLALVENDSRGMRGLIWLSGMDYNDPPSSGQEWRRRRQMQDRYLMAKRLRGEPTVLPSGLRLVRVFPEWDGGLPLWESLSDEYRLSGSDLGLTSDLSDSLCAWNNAWAGRQIDDPLPDGWNERGQVLIRLLQGELEGVAEVRPEFFD